MVSPLSKNLFKRAIVQSGSILHPILSDKNAGLLENTKLLAILVGCTNESTTLENDPQSVVKCLKHKPKEEFVEAEKTIYRTNPAVFYPRVNDNFLPKSSVELFREGAFRGDVEVMLGLTEQEGTLLLMAAVPEFFGNYGRHYEYNMNKYRALSFSRSLLMAFRQSNTSKIINFYMQQVKNRTPVGYVRTVADLAGDFSVACGTTFLADFLAVKGNPVYFYKFAFHPASSPLEEWMGTTHLDELQYIFGNPYHANFTRKEIELSYRLMDRWSAFARTGNPNIPGQMPWFPYSYEQPLYMDFGQEEESIRMKPNSRCEFWRKRFNSEIDQELIRLLQSADENNNHHDKS